MLRETNKSVILKKIYFKSNNNPILLNLYAFKIIKIGTSRVVLLTFTFATFFLAGLWYRIKAHILLLLLLNQAFGYSFNKIAT